MKPKYLPEITGEDTVRFLKARMHAVGIRIDDEDNRIQIRGELITNGLSGLIADLGRGFFVVSEEAAEELTKRGIEFTPVKIVMGSPASDK